MKSTKTIHLVQSLWEQVKIGEGKCLLFTYENHQDIVDLLADVEDNFRQDAAILRAGEILWNRPYYPFVDWIYSRCGEDLEKLLVSQEIYPLHRPIWLADFQDQPLEREELIYEELDYETTKLHQGIRSLFTGVLSDQPTVIILEDINHYPLSTMQFLESSIQYLQGSPLLIIATQNNRKVVANRRAARYWQEETPKAQAAFLKLSIGSYSPDPVQEPPVPVPSVRDINRLRAFLCFGDVRFFQEHSELLPEEVADDDTAYLTEILADSNLYDGENSDALMQYRLLIKWFKSVNNLESLARMYRRLSLIYFIRNNISESTKWAFQAHRLARTLTEKQELFYSLFILMILDPREPFLGRETWIEYFAELLEIGESKNFLNNLAYRLTKPDGLSSVDDHVIIEEYILRGLEIARSLQNELREANAYHILGYQKLFSGDRSEVMMLYKKSEELRKKLGNPLELAYLSNGMGYFLHSSGDFQGGAPYLYQSLEYAQKAGDYHEVCMALTNLSINFLYAQKFEVAGQYLENVIKLMEITNIQNLSFHTFKEILLLYSVAMFLAGNPSRAYEQYTTIRNLTQTFSPMPKTSSEQDEILISCFFEMFLLEGEGDLEGVVKLLDEEKKLLYDNYTMIFYRIPFIHLLYGDILFRNGLIEEAKQEWEDGLEIAHKHHIRYYEQVLRMRLDFRHGPGKDRPEVRELDFPNLLEKARADMDYQKLHKVVEKIDFLNTFQAVLDQYEDVLSLSAKSCDLINATYPADALVFLYQYGGHWDLIYELISQDSQWKFPRERDQIIGGLLEISGATLVDQDSGILEETPFQEALVIPVVMQGETLAFVLMGSFQSFPYRDDEDLKILEIAVAQLYRAVEKLHKDQELAQKNNLLEVANKELQMMATTDALTGLFNRGALMEHLGLERERFYRYKDRTDQHLSVLFLDLDNFKYYNDRFGHDVGDELLRRISAIIRESVRLVDYPARYGGDEFVVILPQTRDVEAEILASRILRRIQEQNGFAELLSSKSGESVEIPADKTLSCSIGIAEFPTQGSQDVEDLLKSADSALYQAKSKGKSQVIIFHPNEISELPQQS